MEHITSRHNPLMGHIRRLAGSAAYRWETGEFLCDSPKLLQEALLWQAEITAVVTISPLPRLPEHIRQVQVPEDVMASISPVKTPQGVLFTCRLPQLPLPQTLTGRQYVLLELRFSAIRAAKSFGYSQEEFLRPLEPAQARAVDADLPELKKSCAAFLRRAIELREEESGNQYKSMLKRAMHYIDQNYTDENLSLNAVAKAANISPNYFSGVFSQEMGQTFVEYLTEKRMARAKELLRYSGKRSSEVAYEVGYRDPRYFSFLFKKTQGCTPSSYRAGNGDGHEAK